MTDSGNPLSGAAGGGGGRWVPDGPVVVVEAVGAEPRNPRGSVVARAAAVVIALGLAGGGAALAINAGSSTGGSATPEAAVEQLLASLSNEDLLGAAEVIEPAERATLVDTGVSISEELVRLEVLSPDLDLGALTGVDLRFDNLTLRSVPIRSDVTDVFIDGGSSRASIDVSQLPLGKLILDRAPADLLNFTDSVSSPISSTNPIAVVKRDGRWYVSLWYSVAENARLAASQPTPSAADRPVPIGADSPEGAVERLIREAARLDPRTVIGMLDPEEMAALYDYAPLFLPQAESAANDALQAAIDADTTWTIDSIGLSSTVDGRLATVRLDGFEGSLTSPDVKAHLSLADGNIDATWTASDYTGGSYTASYKVRDGCTIFETDNPDMGPAFDSCDQPDAMGPFGLGLFGLPGFGLDPMGALDQGIVTRKVDGKWFVSPIRTVTTAMLAGLRAVSPEDLATAADSISGFFTGPFDRTSSIPVTTSDAFFAGSATTMVPPQVPSP